MIKNAKESLLRKAKGEKLQKEIVADLKNGNSYQTIAKILNKMKVKSVRGGMWEIMNFFASSVSPKQWFGKQSDIQNSAILNQAKLINRKFALDVFIDELDRLKSLEHEFWIVHSPSLKEIEDPNLIINNFVLSTLDEFFPDNYLSLADPIRLRFVDDRHLIYKDNVHFKELGHQIVSDTITPVLSNLVN
jgi:hypothetical protein